MSKIVKKGLPPLTHEQFQWVVECLDLRPNAIHRLSSILVDGENVADAAKEAGQTPQATYRLIRQISEEFDRRLEETGKTVVVVIVDQEEVEAVRAFERL